MNMNMNADANIMTPPGSPRGTTTPPRAPARRAPQPVVRARLHEPRALLQDVQVRLNAAFFLADDALNVDRTPNLNADLVQLFIEPQHAFHMRGG